MLSFLGKAFDRWAFWKMGRRRFSLTTAPDALERLGNLELEPALSEAAAAPPLVNLTIADEETTARGERYRRWRAAPVDASAATAPTGLFFGDPGARTALLHVHGWLQPDYTGFAELAAYHTARGAAVWCLELPHHLTRTPAGEFSGARFISGDVEETLVSFSRGLAEITALIGALRDHHGEIVTLGHSLGGLLTALHACLAEDPQERTALLTPATDPLGILLDSPLTAGVRADVLGQGLPLGELARVLAPLNLLRRRPRRDPAGVLLVAARADQVIPLQLQRRLRDAWGCRYHESPTGHLGVMLPLGLFRRPVGLWRAITDHLCPSTG